jgi:hypothetical protein
MENFRQPCFCYLSFYLVASVVSYLKAFFADNGATSFDQLAILSTDFFKYWAKLSESGR